MYKKYFGQKNLHVIKYFYLCIKFKILLFSILRLKSDDFENHCKEISRKLAYLIAAGLGVLECM